MATVVNFDSLWRDVKTASLMVVENLESERPKLELMPSYFGHTLTSELLGAEIAYGMGRSVYSSVESGMYLQNVGGILLKKSIKVVVDSR